MYISHIVKKWRESQKEAPKDTVKNAAEQNIYKQISLIYETQQKQLIEKLPEFIERLDDFPQKGKGTSDQFSARRQEESRRKPEEFHPRKQEEPRTSFQKAEEPKAPFKKAEEPKAPFKKAEEPKAPFKKAEEPKAPFKKAEEQRPSFKKAEEPKAPFKKAEEQRPSFKKPVDEAISTPVAKEKKGEAQDWKAKEESRSKARESVQEAPKAAPAHDDDWERERNEFTRGIFEETESRFESFTQDDEEEPEAESFAEIEETPSDWDFENTHDEEEEAASDSSWDEKEVESESPEEETEAAPLPSEEGGIDLDTSLENLENLLKSMHGKEKPQGKSSDKEYYSHNRRRRRPENDKKGPKDKGKFSPKNQNGEEKSSGDFRRKKYKWE